MPRYIMSIDQGTTSSRAIIFDASGRPVSSSQREFTQHFPKPGWVEHDPDEIWASVKAVIRESLQSGGVSSSDIAAIGITNQRETTVLWDSFTGEPVYNAIVWQSRQSASICEELRAAGLEPEFREKTGLVLDAYFSGTKIAWALRNIEGLSSLMESGRLRFGTVDSWIVHKLTKGRSHITDVTNASRTLLFNIIERKWDRSLLAYLGISDSVLPEVCDSSGVLATTDPDEFFGSRTPICGIAGDQQAALFGQLCLKPGEVKSTCGTGSFLLMNTGSVPVRSKHGLLTTLACPVDGEPAYALEGSIFVAGSAVQWIRDGLRIVDSSGETDSMASSLKGNDGVYFVPAFVGLGTPYWNQDARGTIIGITRGTTRAHIARATLESIAYQTKDVLDAMAQDSGISLAALKVDGGMAKNDFMMGFMADVTGLDVIRPTYMESTAMGAAYLAGLGIGFWKDTLEISANWKLDRRFAPRIGKDEADALYKGWKRAVSAALAAC